MTTDAVHFKADVHEEQDASNLTPSSVSSRPSPVLSMPWDQNTESFLGSIRDSARARSEKHKSAACMNSKLDQAFRMPSLLAPAIAGVMLSIGSWDDVSPATRVSVGSALIVSTISSVIGGQFQFHNKSARHQAFSSRYAALVTKIDFELAKRKEYRQHVDIVLTECRLEFDYLSSSEPDTALCT